MGYRGLTCVGRLRIGAGPHFKPGSGPDSTRRSENVVLITVAQGETSVPCLIYQFWALLGLLACILYRSIIVVFWRTSKTSRIEDDVQELSTCQVLPIRYKSR
jgi:hypothetical protein